MKIGKNFGVYNSNQIMNTKQEQKSNKLAKTPQSHHETSRLDSKLIKHTSVISSRELYRADKVESIKKELSEGTYTIDHKELAKRLAGKIK